MLALMTERRVAKRVSLECDGLINIIADNLEAIESRVARIKARVAELTGNMDSNGNIRTGH